MRRLLLLALMTVLAGAALEGRAQQVQNPNIRDLKDALDYYKSDKSTDRAFALSVMGLMKGDAKSASKEIVKGFYDSNADVRMAADLALKDVNPPLYKPVSTLATSTDYDAKVQAVKDLAALGKDAAPTLPALMGFMKDAKGTERVDIIKTVTSIAPDDPALAPLLTQAALKDSDPAVRAAALLLLPKAPGSADQVKAALGALNDAETPNAKIGAIGVVAATGKGNADATAILKNFLNDKSPQVREAAQKALKAMQGGK